MPPTLLADAGENPSGFWSRTRAVTRVWCRPSAPARAKAVCTAHACSCRGELIVGVVGYSPAPVRKPRGYAADLASRPRGCDADLARN
jgi:hypothetical protein